MASAMMKLIVQMVYISKYLNMLWLSSGFMVSG